jgi:hypothetical protein
VKQRLNLDVEIRSWFVSLQGEVSSFLVLIYTSMHLNHSAERRRSFQFPRVGWLPIITFDPEPRAMIEKDRLSTSFPAGQNPEEMQDVQSDLDPSSGS